MEEKTRQEEKGKSYEEKAELRKKSSLHVVAFVLGIVSVLTPLFYYLALPSGILAIIFGTKSVSKTGSRLGKAGLILGILGLVFCFFVYASIVFVSILAEL
ncbi:DUF4190 domain-containing protein [Candidatus Saccharibacteria bacterium]|nr:DUF4190 domain-containing protein [Candidatus Saccharibacteria bacterium]